MIHEKQIVENKREGWGQPMKGLFSLSLLSLLAPQTVVFEPGTLASPGN